MLRYLVLSYYTNRYDSVYYLFHLPENVHFYLNVMQCICGFLHVSRCARRNRHLAVMLLQK